MTPKRLLVIAIVGLSALAIVTAWHILRPYTVAGIEADIVRSLSGPATRSDVDSWIESVKTTSTSDWQATDAQGERCKRLPGWSEGRVSYIRFVVIPLSWGLTHSSDVEVRFFVDQNGRLYGYHRQEREWWL